MQVTRLQRGANAGVRHTVPPNTEAAFPKSQWVSILELPTYVILVH